MKVLHVITSLDEGGAEGALYRLCQNSPQHEHTVISLTGMGKYGPLLSQEGTAVHALNLPPGRLRISALIRLWRIMRQLRPHCVQTWLYHADLIGGAVARLAGLRNVVWGIRNSALQPGDAGWVSYLLSRFLAPMSWVLPRRIVVCAETARKAHADLGYDRRKMFVIPNGYDLSRFTPKIQAAQALRQRWLDGTATPVIGMVGRYDPMKDHDNLLQALQLLRDKGKPLLCVLVGSGLDQANASLMDKIHKARLEPQVLLLGRRDEVPELMSALDVHVLSSSSEAFPNVLAEAMACGTPCVSTEVGDAALILGDTGWLVPPGKPQALAQGIEQALMARQDAESWASRQAQCRQRVIEQFGMDKMVRAFERVWFEGQELMDSPSPRSPASKDGADRLGNDQ